MPVASAAAPAARRNANDEFKARWRPVLVGSTSIAVALHAALFLTGPLFHIPSDESGGGSAARVQLLDLPHIALPAVTDVPIHAPAIPLVELPDFDLWKDLEVGLPSFDAIAELGEVPLPPIRTARDEWMDYRTFAPMVVRPEIRNRHEMRRFLERGYQPIYRYSGATGVVHVTFWINEVGLVERAEIVESSGSRSLDRLALRVSRVMRFRPAMMAGRPVRILVHIPFTFRAA